MKEAGHEVRGSDTAVYPPMSEQLARAEIPVMLGFGATNLGWEPECVVVGNVCSKDHPEVVEAVRRGLPLESFPSMLAKLLLPGRTSLVVAGTHGKTTTTSLVSWILQCAGADPSFLIGGVPLNFGLGAHLGKGRANRARGRRVPGKKRRVVVWNCPQVGIRSRVLPDNLPQRQPNLKCNSGIEAARQPAFPPVNRRIASIDAYSCSPS